MPHRDAMTVAVAAMEAALNLPSDDPARLGAIATAYGLLANAVSVGFTGLLAFLEEHMGVLMAAQEARAAALHTEIRVISTNIAQLRMDLGNHEQRSIYHRTATDERLTAAEARITALEAAIHAVSGNES
jgi:hypothetical protein